jgi:murein DD-endopeptidase MepM/ murein hydrolase activator NlpD
MKVFPLSMLLWVFLQSSLPLFSQPPNLSFDWKQLKLSWPVKLDAKVAPIYTNGDPYLYPTQYTALNAQELDFMGQKGHNGIDITFRCYRPMDNNGAKIYAAAAGILVAYRDSLDDRMNNPKLWEKFTPANKLAVTQIVPALRSYGLQNVPDGSGNVVYLLHANGFVTQYAHLKKGLNVLKKYKLGDKIPAGALLGIMGSSGASSDPHLHFGVYTGPQSLNPGVTIPSSGRISTIKSGWGYYVCPFYQEPAPSLENMWTGSYTTVYKPLENGNVDVLDLAVTSSNFNTVAPPPNIMNVPKGAPIYIKPYVNGAKGKFFFQVALKDGSGSFFDSSWPSTLQQGETLLPGAFISATNGAFYGLLQNNGQFGIFRGGTFNTPPIWSSPEPNGNGPFYARMNENGSFAIYKGTPSSKTPGNPVWSTPALSGSGPFYANMGLDGNFCVYTKNSKTNDNNVWCSFSNTTDVVPNDYVLLNKLIPGQYAVYGFRQLPGSTTNELRSKTYFNVLDSTKIIIDTLRSTPGINNQLTVWDQFQNGMETRTQFRVFLEQPDTARTIQFAKLSMRLSGSTNINPFTSQWGATMHLRATAHGKTIAFFSPVTVSGRKAEGVIFEPEQLFDPIFYGLTQWPATGLPIDIQFEIKTNNNKQSDYITFDQVTLQYFYGGKLGPAGGRDN